jgi:hypothetical protein
MSLQSGDALSEFEHIHGRVSELRSLHADQPLRPGRQCLARQSSRRIARLAPLR